MISQGSDLIHHSSPAHLDAGRRVELVEQLEVEVPWDGEDCFEYMRFEF